MEAKHALVVVDKSQAGETATATDQLLHSICAINAPVRYFPSIALSYSVNSSPRHLAAYRSVSVSVMAVLMQTSYNTAAKVTLLDQALFRGTSVQSCSLAVDVSPLSLCLVMLALRKATVPAVAQE